MPSAVRVAKQGEPPIGIAAHELFRLLSRSPRTFWPIDYRLPGIDEPLSVLGVGSDVFGVDVEQTFAGVTDASARIVAASLSHRGALVFRDAGDVLDLPHYVADDLVEAVLDAHGIVSPTYSRSNVDAWTQELKAGARHPSTFQAAALMCSAHDHLPMTKYMHERPDRYFGVPLCQLTDGMLLAFRAARLMLPR